MQTWTIGVKGARSLRFRVSFQWVWTYSVQNTVTG